LKPLVHLEPPPADPDAEVKTAWREGLWVGLAIGMLLGGLAILLLLPVIR
jgi:hypothetical protein